MSSGEMEGTEIEWKELRLICKYTEEQVSGNPGYPTKMSRYLQNAELLAGVGKLTESYKLCNITINSSH